MCPPDSYPSSWQSCQVGSLIEQGGGPHMPFGWSGNAFIGFIESGSAEMSAALHAGKINPVG
jgi:hypothetical protein